MTESIEQLEERKRRLELETAIARMERKEKAVAMASTFAAIAPAVLARLLYIAAVLLAFCGLISGFYWVKSLSSSYPKSDLLAQAIVFCAPLAIVHIRRILKSRT